jgi:UDP-glucose 4-epimerase
MLKQIRSGRTSQVLLHTAVIASTLNLGYPNAQTVRDMVNEAQAWFMRGNRHLAEKRIKDAIDTWDTSQKHKNRVGFSRLRSQAARA